MPSVRCAPRWWKGERGVNDPGTGLATVAPPLPPRVVHAPRVPVRGGARVVLDCPENLQDRAGRWDADSASGCAAIQTAITSGIVRARHDAVQGSPLRSDRAHSRAARACHFRPARALGVGVRETLTAPRPSAASGNYVMAGRLRPSRASRDGDAQPLVDLQRIDVLNVQHPARMIGFRL